MEAVQELSDPLVLLDPLEGQALPVLTGAKETRGKSAPVSPVPEEREEMQGRE